MKALILNGSLHKDDGDGEPKHVIDMAKLLF